MKYIKTFNEHSGYTEWSESEEFIVPSVSSCMDEKHVHYGVRVDLKWYTPNGYGPGGLISYMLINENEKQVVLQVEDTFYTVSLQNNSSPSFPDLAITLSMIAYEAIYEEYHIIVDVTRIDDANMLYFTYNGVEYGVLSGEEDVENGLGYITPELEMDPPELPSS